MADVEKCIKFGLDMEGEYSNRKADAGGETMWGITKWLATRYGYPVWKTMKRMSLKFAMNIYRKEFCNKMWLDKVPDQDIANELFEMGIHSGIRTAIKQLQRVLNAFNRYGQDWEELKVDSRMGPNTLRNLTVAIKKRKTNILKGLNVVQGYRFIELAENKNRRDELNINGWFNLRISLQKEVK